LAHPVGHIGSSAALGLPRSCQQHRPITIILRSQKALTEADGGDEYAVDDGFQQRTNEKLLSLKSKHFARSKRRNWIPHIPHININYQALCKAKAVRGWYSRRSNE